MTRKPVIIALLAATFAAIVAECKMRNIFPSAERGFCVFFLFSLRKGAFAACTFLFQGVFPGSLRAFF